MAQAFFSWLEGETPTRVWVNNPTPQDLALALSHGAVGCTTNPAFAGGLLRRAPDMVEPVVRDCVRQSDDDAEVVNLVQRRLVEPIVRAFEPLHASTGGQLGFVSVQAAPDEDHDVELILEAARAARQLGSNAVPKVPATQSGLEALDKLIADGSPTIVTEVFSLSQLTAVCELYVAASGRIRVRPPMFISPITGIFGDHLKSIGRRDGVALASGEAELVGVALARACQRLVVERAYPVTLLCGGARTPFDLLGLVGAPLHVTINWSTFAEVIADNDAPRVGIDDPIDPDVISRLSAQFGDVRAAFDLDGLSPDAFESFGPVQHFRDNFIAGWNLVREAVREQRALIPR